MRSQRRRAAAATAQQSARLERVRGSIESELPRTAAQIESVRAHIAAQAQQLAELTSERDAVLADARQLARLARHLFLTTGAAGFDRPGVQDLLGTYLTAADRRQVPGAFADVELAGLGVRGDGRAGALDGGR